MTTDQSRARSSGGWGIHDDSEIYEDRLVAFIDILGWSDLIHQSVRDRKCMKAVRIGSNILSGQAMGAAQSKAFHGEDRPDLRAVMVELSQFSDTLVLSCPIVTPVCRMLISHVQFVCRMLLEGGHYTRGAIVVGKLHHATHALFGPALIEAYKLEQTVAKYPRIIIAPAARPYCNEPGSFKFKTDFDGLPYVDILGWGEASPDGQRVARWKEEKLLVQARARLRVDKADIGRVAKHQWMINYLKAVLSECQGGVKGGKSSPGAIVRTRISRRSPQGTRR